MDKKVYIGVGHGGNDNGACANGFKEDELNQSTNSKVAEANKYGADLALDIHHNAGGGDGAEVYHTKSFGKGHKLAVNILNEMLNIGQNSRGAKVKKNQYGNDYFGFIRLTNMPAVLVECAFIDNKTDLKIVDTEAERKKMGEAIARGVLKTLGVADVIVPKAMTYSGSFPVLPSRGYLKKGDKGDQVKRLQNFLNWYGGYKLSVDGDFGAKTHSAVKKFQKSEGLTVNGKFDNASLKRAKIVKR